MCRRPVSLLPPLPEQLNPYSAIPFRVALRRRPARRQALRQLQKSKRNKRWRKRKRKHVTELFQKECADYDRIDKEADEWRARQIAKDIAKRKVESTKQIAKKKANEERKRLKSELELALMVEKLQELRSIRVQKPKKQGKIFLFTYCFI
ncbi:U11/U12 small nuclear ribonucleoprotein 59 kDa protein-like [Phragmites australis]|uniref:U11/U12 small nuclear ribonucleoprotein 59 kDa protein-like n=1 Tax=Phragmites australis TaxID=29695 RepID=UPI002D77C142|nr:U11/U12 small nuclear ribonucleoprotein 59 kDa protein-like [Phragmites australis]